MKPTGAISMFRTATLLGVVAAVAFAGAADAHTLRLQCKKLSADDVTCRALFTDGEVARGMTVQLIDEQDKVLRTAKTDFKGEYAFKVPGAEYNVVVAASKGEVASMSSEDIW
jgi:hypothetical protein